MDTEAKVIDMHAHIFPPKIADAAVRGISAFYYERPMLHGGRAEDLLASGQAAGVSRYLVFSVATAPGQVRHINDFILETCAAHPEFIGAGAMHPDFDDYQAELDRIYAAGLRGVKMHADFQKFNMDDPAVFPIYQAISERNMFLIAHAGDFRYEYSRPRRIAAVAKAFPQLRLIAAHFGGWMRWTEARETLNLPNVYLDSSSTACFIGNEIVQKALRHFDPKHIFFGTDFPMWDHGEELARLEELGLPEETLEDIRWRNAAEFLALYGC